MSIKIDKNTQKPPPRPDGAQRHGLTPDDYAQYVNYIIYRDAYP